MTLLIASITPVLIFLYLIFRKDKNKEPISLLAKCFFGGFISIIITLLIDIPIMSLGHLFQTPFLKSFFDSFIVAAIPEEFSKFIILYWIIWKSKFFDEHYDGIVFAVFVSLGFALVENIVYVFEHGMRIAFFRAILAVPGHGLFAVAMGYFLSKAKLKSDGDHKRYLALSLLVPMLMHGIYDFIIMYANDLSKTNTVFSGVLFIIFPFFIIFLWRFGLQRIKISIQKSILKQDIIILKKQ
jgi:RsiW-degrading membrane proteinase PrsW (M82 family)